MDQRTVIFLMLFAVTFLQAQISSFPFKETFDTSAAPKLPAGWSSSTTKNPSGDFITSASSPRSGSLPNCLSASDARADQYVISPQLSFTDRIADSLEFYERRTGTFTAGLLVEASIGSDTLFSLRVSDTLKLTPANNGAYQRRIIPLPDTLSGRSSVRFRWRICGIPGGGGTAVLRLEDVSVTVKKVKDLALTSLRCTPSVPRSGQSVQIVAGIANRAFAGRSSGTLELYDSLALITTGMFSHQFSAQESIAVQLMYPQIAAGRHPLTARLIVSGDEDTTNNIRSAIVNAGVRSGMLLINEVMYTPPAGMPEWVELISTSSDTVRLSGWRISDAGSTKAQIGGTGFLLPHGYAVVTTDTNGFKSQFEIPVPLFQASFSALNNSGDAVVVYDTFGSVTDSVAYLSAWGGGPGRSLERIDTAFRSTEQTNWASSRHPDGATPGTVNSLTRKDFDAAVKNLSAVPRAIVTGTPVQFNLTIVNTGRRDLSAVRSLLFIDANNDSLFGADELRREHFIPVLNTGDSVLVNFSGLLLPQGVFRVGVTVRCAQDDDSLNNHIEGTISVGVPPAGIVITEILYAPTEGLPEWIELYNTTEDSISLYDWTISDNGSARAIVAKHGAHVPPKEYCLVTTDSLQFSTSYTGTAPVFQTSFPSLNNTTPDAVVVRDNRGFVMDSIHYDPRWGGSGGNSLQRYDLFASPTDSANWRSGQPSAGKENAVARKDDDAEIRRISSENISGGVRITAVLFNSGRRTITACTLKLYHDNNADSLPDPGELLTELPVPMVLPLDSVTMIYDWTMTLYGKQQLIALGEYQNDQRSDNNAGITTTAKSFVPQSMVINEIMYDPAGGMSEFVELLNNSADTLDVNAWALMDQPSASGNRTVIRLSSVSKKVPPGGMFLAASDSSLVLQFPALPGTSFIVHSSLSLSNSGEDLVLVDLTGTVIDSVRYSPLWQLKQFDAAGRSLERIDPAIRSTDRRNWSSSVAQGGATPLRQNSIYIGSVAPAASLALSPNPFSPDQDGYEDFLSVRYSIPAGSVSIRIRIFDVTGRLIRRLAQNEPSASSGSVLWDGRDDDGNRARIGLYIILLEALDHFGGTLRTMKDVAVVARKL
jgi:hypothetical protein